MDKISSNDEFHTDEKITDEKITDEKITDESELKEGELSQDNEKLTDDSDFDIDFDDELNLDLELEDEVFDEEALTRRLIPMSPIVKYVRARMKEIANTKFSSSGEAKKALVEVGDQYLKEMLDVLCAELVSIMFLNKRRTIDRGHVAYAMEHVFKLFINRVWDDKVLKARANLISKIFKVKMGED